MLAVALVRSPRTVLEAIEQGRYAEAFISALMRADWVTARRMIQDCWERIQRNDALMDRWDGESGGFEFNVARFVGTLTDGHWTGERSMVLELEGRRAILGALICQLGLEMGEVHQDVIHWTVTFAQHLSMLVTPKLC